MLLPSLTRAKEAARRSLCLVNVRSAAIGFLNYSTEWDAFLPGPNTTGYAYRKGGHSPVIDSNRFPLQADDWMSPVLGRERTLPLDPAERLVEMFNNKFRCPSNTAFYDTIFEPRFQYPPPSLIRYNSYSAPLTLHTWSDAADATRNGQAKYGLSLVPEGKSDPMYGCVDLTKSGHRMRLDTIGMVSMKVAVTEGARYVENDGTVNFQDSIDPAKTSWGSNFMNRGPGWNCYYQDAGEPYKFAKDVQGCTTLGPYGAKYAYRHNGQICMSFLDGHATAMDQLSSRKVDYWFPSGAVILKKHAKTSLAFGDQDICNLPEIPPEGIVIP
jgi:prepilin-type processing-associated H-X9-DG protein